MDGASNSLCLGLPPRWVQIWGCRGVVTGSRNSQESSRGQGLRGAVQEEGPSAQGAQCFSDKCPQGSIGRPTSLRVGVKVPALELLQRRC